MSLSSSAPWLKYYGNVPHHLSYPQKTIYQMVKAAAERNPKLPAYEFMGKKTTFAQFMQKIDETAQAFLAMGIKKGDRVTICMPNCPQALHAFYGLNRIGAVSVQPNQQHDPSPLRRGRDQILSQFLALQVHPHA